MMSLERRAIKLLKLYTVNKELAPKKIKINEEEEEEAKN